MDQKFLMGQADLLERTPADADASTFISPPLRARLTRAAIAEAVGFYRTFFGPLASPALTDPLALDSLADAYAEAWRDGRALGLFQKGGIREKDHLNFWCLSHVLAPSTYVESGVFIGSSLHAFLCQPGLQRIVAIDPNLRQLKVPRHRLPDPRLIDDRDFSQLDLPDFDERTFAYFDDHINTAERIIQAADKGLPFVMFDDSTGVQGVCQRLYPAVPTVPMIMHHEAWLAPGDELAWTFEHPRRRMPLPTGLRARLKFVLFPNRYNHEEAAARRQRVSMTVTQALIDTCRAAKQRVKRYAKIPDLGDYLPLARAERMVDTSKYLLELAPAVSS